MTISTLRKPVRSAESNPPNYRFGGGDDFAAAEGNWSPLRREYLQISGVGPCKVAEDACEDSTAGAQKVHTSKLKDASRIVAEDCLSVAMYRNASL